MLWMLPVAVALFWFITYRKAMAMPPLWNLRAPSHAERRRGWLSPSPVVGAAAWMGSREGRRRITDLVTITARPRWPACSPPGPPPPAGRWWRYLGCLAVLYGVTAQQATWGGPLWWPAAVGAASVPAFCPRSDSPPGRWSPSRFTTPLVAIAAFFALALSTELITGGQSYWQISPIVTGPWDTGADAGVATFYPYLPDLPIAQVMFLAGLTVAVLGVLAPARAAPAGRWLRRSAAADRRGRPAGGGDRRRAGRHRHAWTPHGMIAIPALHDAASDRPLRFTPVCSHTAIPVCLNPAYASYLPAATAALAPVLGELAGLPGAPARISQAAATYHQGTGNVVSYRLAGPAVSGRPPVFRLLLPDQCRDPAMTASASATALRSSAGPRIVASVIDDVPGASQAQQVPVAAAAA